MPMKPIIFGLIIIIRALFLCFEGDVRMYHYLLNDNKIGIQGFIWYLGELTSIIALSFMSIFRDNSWPITTKVFVFCTVFDIVDFLMTGNSVWFKIGSFPVCSNTLVGAIFGLGLIFEAWKTRLNTDTLRT